MESVIFDEPYFFASGFVGLSFSQYIKMEDYGLPLEGVLSVDFNK